MKKFIYVSIVIAFSLVSTNVYAYNKLAERLHGYILLQVEEHGEAWYVRSDQKRSYMRDGDVAYSMMRFFSIGITDADLEKIPSVETTDEMLAAGSICGSNALAARLSGEILLQVEQHGEAWYVYPKTCRRIYLKDGDAAYQIMRFLGLGITNADLDQITPADEAVPVDVPEGQPVTEPSVPIDPEEPTDTSEDQDDPGTSIIAGRYADPDVLKLSDGTWKMFFGVEPEVVGNQFEVYSATSSDGLSWELDENAILTFSTFPDAVELPSGDIRLYTQQGGEIYSSISINNGETFQAESGVRISITGDRDSDGVAAPSVLRLNEGGYLMVFRAAEAGAYQPTSINSTTTTFFLASSDDGLNWQRGNIVVDSRQEPYDGYIDGPELFYNDEGSIELRFWTSGIADDPQTSGQYRMISGDEGMTWTEPEQFSTILGGDPTYQYLEDGTLAMYYTIHTKGVYLKEL